MSEYKGIQTSHGLKYLLSESVYKEVSEVDNGTNTVWNKINCVIESREMIPELVGFIVFTVLALMHQDPWTVCIFALASCILCYCVRSIVFLYKIPLITITTVLLGFIPRFLLDKIVIIAISIGILHNWIVGAVYVLVDLIISLMLARSYQKNVPFNDVVAREICKGEKNEYLFNVESDKASVKKPDLMAKNDKEEETIIKRELSGYDRKISGSISTDIVDIPRTNLVSEKATEESSLRKQTDAPTQSISTAEYQRKTLAFAKDACEYFYKDMLEIQQDYMYCDMDSNDCVEYEQKWADLAVRTKKRCALMADFLRRYEEQPDKDLFATHSYKSMMSYVQRLVDSIYQYASVFVQMQQCIDESRDGDFDDMMGVFNKFMDKCNKDSIDEYYYIVENKYQNLLKAYQKQTGHNVLW